MVMAKLTVAHTQEMIREQDKLRTGPKIYHDIVFEEEIKNLINVTRDHYEAYVSSPRLHVNRTPDVVHTQHILQGRPQIRLL